MHMRSIGTARALGAAIAGMALTIGVVACDRQPNASAPHVDRVMLPTHKTWRVVAVQPYEGLADVELVRFDWPTPTEPSIAFALTREGLSVGDGICLDHVHEIDTFWAHPVPDGGCEKLGVK